MKALITLIFIALACVSSKAGIDSNDVTRLCDQLRQTLSSSACDAQKAIDITAKLGLAGVSADCAWTALNGVYENRVNNTILRAYAAWACDKIRPKPQSIVGKTYHVAQLDANASDLNPGTEQLPWKTIQKAAETLSAGDTVIIHKGEYREFVRPFREGTGPDRMITYMAAQGETPILKGSDIWVADWKNEGGGLWSASYKRHIWDTPELWRKETRSEPKFRCEQIIADGKVLDHVASAEELSKADYFFYTDDVNCRIWLHIKKNTAPNDCKIERSMRQHVFLPAVSGLGYIRVKGLTMCHAASPRIFWGSVGIVAVMGVRGGHHWIIEENTIEWGHAQGLDLGNWTWTDSVQLPVISDGGFHLVKNNKINCNGVTGIAGGLGEKQSHITLTSNETNYNGYIRGAFHEYECAGVKFHHAEDVTIVKHTAYRNDGFGIWFDWAPKRCRVSQCVLKENMGAGLFLEASWPDGGDPPLLADNNVIVGTRTAPANDWDKHWADGIYSHNAGRAIYVNNYIRANEGFGIRLRRGGERIGPGDKVCDANGNVIINNFIFNNDQGAIKLNPDIPGAINKISNNNVFWNKGKAVTMSLETEGMLNWEATQLGKALGAQGNGELQIDFANWRKHTNWDANSLELPPGVVFKEETPVAILATLKSYWPVDAPALGTPYQLHFRSEDLHHYMAWGRSSFCNGASQRTVRLGPGEGVSVLKLKNKTSSMHWNRSKWEYFDNAFDFDDRNFINEKELITLTPGELATVKLEPGMSVFKSGLPYKIISDSALFTADVNLPLGMYSIIFCGRNSWTTRAINVVSPIELIEINPVATPRKGIRLSIKNNSNLNRQTHVQIKMNGQYYTARHDLKQKSMSEVLVDVNNSLVGNAELTLQSGALSFYREKLVSFVTIPNASDWTRSPEIDLHDFPGGLFPENLGWLLHDNLKSSWLAYHDDDSLYIRVIVQDPTHLQKADYNSLWQQDSVQLLVRPELGKALELTVARANDGNNIVFRSKSPNIEKYPLGKANDVGLNVDVGSEKTTYSIKIPLEMTGFIKPIQAKSLLRLSLLVNNFDNKESGRNGLQWFFGIHKNRDSDDAMGYAWLE